MSSNWNNPPDQSNGGSSAPQPRKNGLLSSYRQSGTLPASSSPPPSPMPGPPSPSSPMSPSAPTGGAWPAAQRNFIASTLNMIRSWSGKIASVNGYSQQQQPPIPLEPYRQTGKEPQTLHKPWRRSHAMRMVMLRRRRRERQNGFNGLKLASSLLIAALLLLIVLSSSGTVYAYNYYNDHTADLQDIASQHIAQETRIFDRNGVLLYEVYDQSFGSSGKRTPVAYKDIPWVLQQTMIAAEDPSFWDNTGVDFWGIIRAAGNGGGASTITQQLIKQLTGNSVATGFSGYQRKLNESILAVALTQDYPKSKIMEMYFNITPFDTSDLGVEAAFEKYFGMQPDCDQNHKCTPAIAKINKDSNGKDDPILGLARATLLAGMPQSPNHYDPTLTGNDDVITEKTHKQLALDRQQYVLNQMMKNNLTVPGLPGDGLVTPEIAAQVGQITAKMDFKVPSRFKRAPHFVDWVINQVATTLGNGDYGVGLEAFLTGGFQIKTTIDVNFEDYVERAITRHLTQTECQQYTGCGPLSVTNNIHDGAVVAMNAHTGEILAMAGSADYYATGNKKMDGNFNVTTTSSNWYDLGRQAGSTFKPFVYAAAFEQGWYPGMVVPDFKTNFPNGAPAGTISDDKHLYTPQDYLGQYGNKYTTIRLATAESRNVPAVKAMLYVGLDNVHNFVQRLGVTSLDRFVTYKNKTGNAGTFDQIFGAGSSIALGSVETPLIQMVGGYQAFANGGLHIPPQSILDIWDNYGHNLYHYDPAHPPTIRAMSPQVAYMMTSILIDEPARAAEFGSIHTLSFGDINAACIYQSECPLQVAAKTGTTDKFVDNLTIGYTPNVVVGVWVGNADSSPLINSIGITGAAPIWHSVIERAAGYCPANINPQDHINCGNFNLGLSDPKVFPKPDGLMKFCVSAKDGLQGSGACDYMLASDVPQQKGVSPNPPPDPNNPDGNGNPNGG